MSTIFDGEPKGNDRRQQIAADEPIGLRTKTPTLAVIAESSGLFHFTPDGRRLADFTSGVLVTNLGHHHRGWLDRFYRYLQMPKSSADEGAKGEPGFDRAPPWTAYNAISELEAEANRRLLASLRKSRFGARLEKVMWSASGSEGIQKALWACLRFQPDKDVILATRHGFHGKKGLAGAVTGDEHTPDRDRRVHFIDFPKAACRDVSMRGKPFDPRPHIDELERFERRFPGRINCLITEPYLGGGGSFHPPREYHQALFDFCTRHGIVTMLDEVQSNFGRTGSMYAFETYGIAPDIVVLGKGMGNGVPVNAAVGRAEVLESLAHGEASDTWSAHTLGCAATLATLDIFETDDILGHTRKVSALIERGLVRLKELPIVAAVRGEGMVWGVEFTDDASGPTRRSSNEVAMDVVRQAYLGDDAGNAIHLLGPLSGNVIRISPPLTITEEQATFWMEVLYRVTQTVAGR